MLEAILGHAAIQSGIAVVVVTFIGLWIRRAVWVKHVVALGVMAYQYAEEEGILQGLAGFAKFEPFMRRFIEAYYEQYGKSPPPKAKAVAVEAMEKAVVQEHLGN